MNKEVTQFLKEQNHPLSDVIELIRNKIISAEPDLDENIKWNGPNYSYNGEDRITMKIHPPKSIQIIFHCGAKVREQPPTKLIDNDFGLLTWKENNRAIATFKNTQEVNSKSFELRQIVKDWIKSTLT
ncbi:MAG: DUF1801 domain-containing protein [Sediminibacterium sp.]